MNVTCIRCNVEGCTVTFDLDGTKQFRCLGCEEEFTCEDVREVIAGMKRWEKVLAWAEQYPVEE